jgi:hypothetical protein
VPEDLQVLQVHKGSKEERGIWVLLDLKGFKGLKELKGF